MVFFLYKKYFNFLQKSGKIWKKLQKKKKMQKSEKKTYLVLAGICCICCICPIRATLTAVPVNTHKSFDFFQKDIRVI